MKKILSISFVMAVLFSSCTQDQESFNSDLNSQILNDVTFISDSSKDPGDIISISFGRVDYDCKGWGICVIREGDENDRQANTLNNKNVQVRFSLENDQMTFDLRLNASSKFDLNQYPILIDQDIEVNLGNGKTKVIKAGAYSFDNSIGEFGGFQIQSRK